jgi:hypothetical protein
MPTLQVDIIGSPDTTVNVREEIDRRNLGAVVQLPGHIPYDETLRAMVSADALLLVDQAGRRKGVPAKLYEYLGAGRPILALVEPDSDSSWVLAESGVPHHTASPSDPQAIRQALVKLVAELRTGQGRSRGAPEGRLAFTRESLTRKLAGILDGCAAARAEPGSLAGRSS